MGRTNCVVRGKEREFLRGANEGNACIRDCSRNSKIRKEADHGQNITESDELHMVEKNVGGWLYLPTSTNDTQRTMEKGVNLVRILKPADVICRTHACDRDHASRQKVSDLVRLS